MKLFLFFCITSTVVFGEVANDTESPKNDGETTSLPPITDRVPRIQCPETTYLYPLMNKNYEFVSWRCRCKSSLLYLPSNTSCHAAYREGPCGPGKYVAPYADGSFTEIGPEGRCIENPCTADNLVLYNGSCYTLGERKPCAFGYVLGVHRMTFEVFCQKIFKHRSLNVQELSHFFSDVPKSRKLYGCPTGTIKTIRGECWTLL